MVPIDDIEKQIEKTTAVLINSKEKVHPWLYPISNQLAELLNQQSLLPIKYFYPLEKLIKLFDTRDVVIPAELNDALFKVLMNFDHYFDNSEERAKAINDSLDIVDILGAHVY